MVPFDVRVDNIPMWLVTMGREGVTPQTTWNHFRSDIPPNQIQSLENTKVVGLQSSSLCNQGEA